MKPLRIAGTAVLALLISAPCAMAGEPSADDLIKEFRGEAEAVKRSPEQLEAAYAKVLDALVPRIKGEDPGPRKDPEQTLEWICWRAGRPGAEAERLAVCKALSKRLGADISKEARIWLIKQLRHIGREEAVGALAAGLSHQEARVRERARRALQDNPSPKAGDVLRSALAKARTPEWRVALINALAYRKDAATVQALIRQASEGNDDVRTAAVEALGCIGDVAAAGAIEAATSRGSDRAKAVATDNCLLLADKLCAQGEKTAALGIYHKLLGAKGHVRCAAIIGLGHAGGPRELPTIFEALASGDPRERGAGLAALELLPPDVVVQAIQDKLKTAPPDMKVALLRALMRRADKAVLPAFIAAAGDANGAVRVAAYEGIGKLRDPATAPVLIAALLKAQGNELGTVQRAINRVPGKAMADALIAALAKAEPKGRVEIVRCLALRQPDTVAPTLLGVAEKDADASVRSEAFKALTGLADVSALPQLVRLMMGAKETKDRSAAEKAVVAVARRIEDESQRTKVVLAALGGASVPARCSLLRVAGRLGGDDALKAVRAARKDSNAEVQDTAIRILARWDEPSVADELLDIAKNAKTLAHRVLALDGYVRVVGLMSGRPTAELLKMYEAAMAAAPRDKDRKRVLSGVAQVGNLGALRMAQQYLEDPKLRAEAEAAVVKIARAIGASSKAEARAALTQIIKTSKNKRLIKQARGGIATIERFDDYIVAWQVAGPYAKSGTDGRGLFRVVFPPEKPDAKDVKWRNIPAGTDRKRPWVIEIDHVKAIHGNNRAAYLRTRVWSPKKQQARMELGSDDGVKVWLNRKLVHANNAFRPAAPAQDKAKVALQEGWNDLLLKITQGGGHWEACLRFRTLDGAELEGIRAQTGGEQ